MTASIFNPGGVGAIGPRMTDYHAAITREYPVWTATLTGGDLAEHGHVITSLSYARLCGEVQDWLEWHYDRPPRADEQADDYDDGEGFQILCDYGFPIRVNEALDRYWQAGKQRSVDGRAVVDIYNGLCARVEDVAAMLHLSEEQVRRFIEEEDWRRAGRTHEDLRAWREQREAES